LFLVSGRKVGVAVVVVVLIAVVLAVAVVNYVKLPASSTSSSPTTAPKTVNVVLTVRGDWKMGPDGKLHDAFDPTNFTVNAVQTVNLTVVNYDSGQHSFVCPPLGVSLHVAPCNATSVPSVQSFQFSPLTAGVYRWYCTKTCDTDAGGWAMTTGSDDQPCQIGYMGGFVTVQT
jgi:heme/copper-type cytochrome/quinol oxidase subunit 2